MAQFRHSDPFVGELHTKRFWLPILWGMRPDEFSELHDLCRTAVYLERMHDWGNLAILEDELLDRPWLWARGSSVGDLLWEQLLRRYPHLGTSAEIVLAGHFARIVRVFWHAITDAHLELSKPFANRRDLQLRRLHPLIAVAVAAEVV